MYKAYSADELRKHLGLPKGYHVDAFITYGGWDAPKYKRMLLDEISGKCTVEKLKGFIQPILSVKIGKRRIWFCVEYGGAKLSEFTHFACMFGSRKNILIGTCGCLKKGMHAPAILVPDSSYSTESSCHTYLRGRTENLFHPSKKLSERLSIKLAAEGLNVVHGPTLTCQAMMGETWEDVINWSDKGFHGVEMEASTIFAVSEHFDVPAAAMLQMTDNLIEQETMHSESYVKKRRILRRLRRKMFSIAAEEALEQ